MRINDPLDALVNESIATAPERTVVHLLRDASEGDRFPGAPAALIHMLASFERERDNLNAFQAGLGTRLMGEYIEQCKHSIARAVRLCKPKIAPRQPHEYTGALVAKDFAGISKTPPEPLVEGGGR